MLGAVKVGDKITYEISYENGNDDAADIIITDKLDTNVTYVSSEPSGVYSDTNNTVVWRLSGVPAKTAGTVKLIVEVKEDALESKGGPGKVVNGGDTATVKVGNEPEVTLNTVENPVPDGPVKTETSPYAGTRSG